MNLERYRLYHEHHCRESEDLPFWVRVARRWGHAGTLELGCGTGRVYHALRDAGVCTFGVDLDPGMLAILREQEHLKGRSSVFRGDMRSLGIAAGSFGLVILPCNTFSTFSAEAQAEIVSEIARVLFPKGVFVVSMPNPSLLATLPSYGNLELDTTFPHPLSGEMVQAFSAWQRIGERFELQWEYRCAGRRYVWQVQHILQPPEAYVRLLEAHGLEVASRFGDFEHGAFDEESEILCLVAEKS